MSLLWEAYVSFLCTPDWTVWLRDNIRLSEISTHEGAVKLVKKKEAPDSCPLCLCRTQCPKSSCECGTILIGPSALSACLSNVPKPLSSLSRPPQTLAQERTAEPAGVVARQF